MIARRSSTNNSIRTAPARSRIRDRWGACRQVSMEHFGSRRSAIRRSFVKSARTITQRFPLSVASCGTDVDVSIFIECEVGAREGAVVSLAHVPDGNMWLDAG